MVRVDFNVPIVKGKIRDDFKIERQLKTIDFLVKRNCRVILLTHLGRPKAGQTDSEFSTKPLARHLSGLLNKRVIHIDDIYGFKAQTAVSRMKHGQVLILENIRFARGETENSSRLAKELSRLADIYVNEAFAASHRKHASVAAIKKYLPSYAGFLLDEEVKNLKMAWSPKKPMVVVIGGVKLETKLPLLKKLAPRADKILVGGGLANNFLVARNFSVGRSEINEKSVILAKKIYSKKIILPLDAVVAKKSAKWKPRSKDVGRVERDEYIFDIGPKTINFYAKMIKEANTILWNGPLGMFEENDFRHGTLAIAEVIAARSRGPAFGIVGGGETVAAIHMTRMAEYVDWISTGGGAMLAFLSGEPMPGLKGII